MPEESEILPDRHYFRLGNVEGVPLVLTVGTSDKALAEGIAKEVTQLLRKETSQKLVLQGARRAHNILGDLISKAEASLAEEFPEKTDD